MITEQTPSSGLTAVCPECKNNISLSRYPNIAKGMVIECDHCGMTLLVQDVTDTSVKTAIVDEGK